MAGLGWDPRPCRSPEHSHEPLGESLNKVLALHPFGPPFLLLGVFLALGCLSCLRDPIWSTSLLPTPKQSLREMMCPCGSLFLSPSVSQNGWGRWVGGRHMSWVELVPRLKFIRASPSPCISELDLIWRQCLHQVLSFYFPFLFSFLAAPWHMEFPGQGSDLTYATAWGTLDP